MKFILGEKIDMTQLWVGDERKAVTKIKVHPCVVLQLKTVAKDGYSAVQVGTGAKKPKNTTKSLKGHFKNLGSFRYVKEFRLDKSGDQTIDLATGDILSVTSFAVGDSVKVTGVSKGKGFAGVVKRHGFHGHNATHGTKDQIRMPGSIGAGGVQHVFKGVRMAGRMGDEQVTIPKAKIIEVNEAQGSILIEGGVPGARHSLVMISAKGELKLVAKTKVEATVEAPAETVVETPVAVETPEVAANETEATPETAPETDNK